MMSKWKSPKRSFRSPGLARPPAPLSPFTLLEGGGVQYGFTLRRSEGVELGLDFDVCEDELQGKGLRVKGVAPGSAIDSWNRVWDSDPATGKEVTVGDMVISVNGQTDPEAMLRECRMKMLLKLVVVRGGDDKDAEPTPLHTLEEMA